MKAILELPKMPESCSECPCAQYYDTYGECGAIEYDIDGDFRPVLPSEGRRSDCPLKLVDKDILEKQKPKKVVETPDKHKYGYCPVCGLFCMRKDILG